MSLLILAVLTACGGGVTAGDALTVLAASSLTDAFTELADDFEDTHPEASLTLSFAGSQTLATQVRHGLAADVLASAHVGQLEGLMAEGLALDSRVFAHNRLVLVVSEQVEGEVSLEDLAVERLVLGAPEVPIGQYTDALLHAAEARYGAAWRQGVEDRVVSRELSVRLVAAKVAMGEADAGVVYATDAVELDGVRVVPLPPELAPQARYLHSVLSDAPSPALAETWLTWVEGPQGQAILERRGFGTP